jgi:hypothetical protein
VTAIALSDAPEELSTIRDPAGVLTIYVDAGADREARHRPRRAEIELRERLDGVRRRLDAEGDATRRRLLDERLAELAPALEDLVDPGAPGAGRALVVPLSGGAPRAVVADAGMGHEVVLDRSPYLLPLVAAGAQAAPAGVVCVSGDLVRAIDVRGSRAVEAMRAPIDVPTADWRPMVGPSDTTPGHAAHSESQRDLFGRRLEEHRARRIAELAERVRDEAEARGWDAVVVAGEPEHVAALGPPAGTGAEVVALGRALPATLSPEEVRAVTAPAITEARRQAARALALRVRDTALAVSGRAALGVDDVLGALAEGRVHRLVIDPSVRQAGARAPDGTLVAAGEVAPGETAAAMAPEPNVMERMVERALATGARIAVVDGDAAEPLADCGGVAAELRW